MKKISLFCALFMGMYFSGISQERILNYNINKNRFGFNLGLNQSFLSIKRIPAGVKVSNKPGLSIGGFYERRLSRRISFSPRTNFTLNQSALKYKDNTSNSFFDICFELKTHFLIKPSKYDNKFKPLVILGPSLKQGYSNDENYYSLGFDLGLGFENYLAHFTLVPELIYSYGLSDLEKTTGIPYAHFHSLGLFLNFK